MKESIYLESRELNSIDEMESKVKEYIETLKSESKKVGEIDAPQYVIKLQGDEKGTEWLMFVYYSKNWDNFSYSFQDEDYWDTDFETVSNDEEIIEKVLDEITAVGGFHWMSLDF